MANEKRLIDADAFIEDIKTEIMNLYLDGMKGTPRPRSELYDIIDRIGEQPTVDAVEVVRCKDCKHCTVTSDGIVCECALPTKRIQDYYIYGSTILARVEPDAFCSYGERRSDG